MPAIDLKHAIAALGRFQRGAQHAVVQATRRVSLPALREATRLHLNGLAKTDEERAYADIVADALTGRGTRDGAVISLKPPVEEMALFAARREQLAPMDRRMRQELQATGNENLEIVRMREAVEDWVAIEKELDETDPDDIAQVADNIQWIMGIHPDSRRSNWTPGMQAAAARLTPHVLSFMARSGYEQALLPETLQAWLMSLPPVWWEVVSRELRIAVPQELQKLWRRSLR